MGAATAGKNRLLARRGERESHGEFLLRLALGCVIICPSIFLSGCGLESVDYYTPPDFAYAGNIITLRHNSSNGDSSFLGYDIYYRAYYSLTEADTARSSIESVSNSTTATPESVLSKMTSELNFKKIYLYSAYTTSPTPLLKGATTYFFYLPNDNNTTNWYYVTNSSSTPVAICRSTGYGDSFNSPYHISDADYGSTSNGVGSTQAVFIVAFAVAYGYDFGKLQSIYSFPASLYQEIGGSNGYTLP
jgi:hypothetical protein